MIGDQIRRLRVSAGLSQTELAQKAKIGIATVSRIERDAGNPTRDSLEAIAGALETTVESLMRESDLLRQQELAQTGLLVAAFERMTEQLAGVVQAHADLKRILEDLLVLQGWPRRGGAEERLEVARRMLDLGLEIETISQATGISRSEVERIKLSE